MASPGLEHGDGPRIEVDGASTAGGLHVGDARFVLDRLNLLFDDEAGVVEVDVAPGEPEHFAAAHAGVGGEVDRHVPLAVFDAREELAKLLGGPGVHLAGACSWRVGEVGDVAGDAALAHRVGECLADDAVDVAHRLR